MNIEREETHCPCCGDLWSNPIHDYCCDGKTPHAGYPNDNFFIYEYPCYARKQSINKLNKLFNKNKKA